MMRLIDAVDLQGKMMEMCVSGYGAEDMIDAVIEQPTVDAVPVCRRVNAIGGTDRMAEYYKAEEQGRLIVLPDVPEKDRQSVLDFLRECRADWIHDPSVGLFGPNEEEAALMDAIEAALEVAEKQQ